MRPSLSVAASALGAISTGQAPGYAADQEEGCESTSSSLEWECACCCDLLIEPVVAPCGHDMCRACYVKWCQASPAGFPACPMCRAPMPTSLGVCMRLKRTVESLEPVATKRRRLEGEACSADRTACGSGSGAPAMEQPCHAAVRSTQHPNRSLLQRQRSGPSRIAGLAQHLQEYAQFQQMALLAGMYTLYHQHTWWAAVSMQPPPRADWWPAASAASSTSSVTDLPIVLGTPVADLISSPDVPPLSQQPLQGHWACAHGDTLRFPATPTAAMAMAASTCGPTRALPQPPVQPLGQWQTVLDVPLRLACAHRILAMLRARMATAGATAMSAWVRLQQQQQEQQRPHQGAATAPATEPAVLAMVRAVEVQLYRQAESRQAYTDPSTLPERVAMAVRRRVEVARARAGLVGTAPAAVPAVD